jgi:Ca2+-binding EF-hand superfamily protein
VGLARKFKIADTDRSGEINFGEFTVVVAQQKIAWTAAQTKLVFDQFDKDKSGSISYDEFLYGVRGDLNERRKQLVLQAFGVR